MNSLSKKLTERLPLEELSRVEQQFYDLHMEFYKEMDGEREKLSSLLYEVLQKLVETEKEFISSLINHCKNIREENVFLCINTNEQVSMIEESILKETNLDRLREMVLTKLGTISLNYSL